MIRRILSRSLRQVHTPAVLLAIVCAQVISLSACGGAGEGANNAGSNAVGSQAGTFLPVPNRQSDPPLIHTDPAPIGIKAGNEFVISDAAMGNPNLALTFAKLAIDSWNEFRTPGNDQITLACANGGFADFRFEDVDASGTSSIGDRMFISWRNCGLAISGAINGSLALTRITPSSTAYQFALHARFENGFTQTNFNSNAMRKLSGSLVFEHHTETTQDSWRVGRADSDDFTIALPGFRGESINYWRSPDVRKLIRYDLARIETTINAQLLGTLTHTPLQVTTAVPIRNAFDECPNEGLIVVSDANRVYPEKLSLRMGTHNNARGYSLELDTEGNAVPATQLITSCGNVMLWWANRASADRMPTIVPFAAPIREQPPAFSVPPVSSLPSAPPPNYGYPQVEQFDSEFTAPNTNKPAFRSIPSLQGRYKSVHPTIALQLSRTLASETRLAFQFNRIPPYTGLPPSVNPPADPAIEARFQVHGALLLITPTRQLAAGHSYTVSAIDLANPGAASDQIRVSDISGNTTTLPIISFTARMDLTPVVTPDRPAVINSNAPSLLLSAANSIALRSPISSYRWRQVGGTPLAIEDATQKTTRVSLLSPLASTEELVPIELELSSDSGEIATTRFNVHVLPATAPQLSLYLKGDEGAFELSGKSLLSTVASGYASIRLDDNGRDLMGVFGWGTQWIIRTVAPIGTVLRPGAYENTTWYPTTGPGLYANSQNCRLPTGRFNYLEFETNVSGQLTKLALDFEFRCNGETAALRGSMRYNSIVPLRP